MRCAQHERCLSKTKSSTIPTTRAPAVHDQTPIAAESNAGEGCLCLEIPTRSSEASSRPCRVRRSDELVCAKLRHERLAGARMNSDRPGATHFDHEFARQRSRQTRARRTVQT